MLIEQTQQFHDVIAILRVEITGWFVCEDQFWICNHRARNGHTLLLAARELGGFVARAVIEANQFKRFSDAAFPGGFRDFTRIASSDPVMWRDIALANRDELLAAIDSFSDHLQRLRDAVDSGDGEGMLQTFSSAKATRDAFASRQASK